MKDTKDPTERRPASGERAPRGPGSGRTTRTAPVVAAATLLAVTGCSSTPDPAPSPAPNTAAPAPSSSTEPAEAAARRTVLERYRAFRQAYDDAGRRADYRDKAVTEYLESPLKQKVVAFLLQTSQHHAVYRGTAESNPSVSMVALTARPRTATVADCYDSTGYRLYYTRTNEPVPVKSGPRRFLIETVATDFGGSKGWMLTSSQSYPERTC